MSSRRPRLARRRLLVASMKTHSGFGHRRALDGHTTAPPRARSRHGDCATPDTPGMGWLAVCLAGPKPWAGMPASTIPAFQFLL
jgi:hypothetical protein